ncbi:MAG: anhydro-N-acetylmuramic acid kinase, partial [Sphaerochaetaceae bacterium]
MILTNLLKQKSKLVIGLMSGTSLDGVDAVLIRLSGSGLSTKYEQLSFITLPYSKVEIEALLKLAKG